MAVDSGRRGLKGVRGGEGKLANIVVSVWGTFRVLGVGIVLISKR